MRVRARVCVRRAAKRRSPFLREAPKRFNGARARARLRPRDIETSERVRVARVYSCGSPVIRFPCLTIARKRAYYKAPRRVQGTRRIVQGRS